MELALEGNRVGDDGAEALAAALSANTALKKLALSGNRVNAAQQRVVAHVLRTRQYKMYGRRTADPWGRGGGARR